MILLSYDTETTGVNPLQDRVIEVGAVLYTTGFHRTLEATSYLVQSDVPVSEEIERVTGVNQKMLDAFGYEQASAMESLIDLAVKADAIIAYNGLRFDKRITESWAKRLGVAFPEKLWIDPMYDLPGVEVKKLEYQAADHGFLPLEKHSALADAQTTLKITMDSRYKIEDIVKRAQSPMVVIKSHHERDNNSTAKKFKFRWNPDQKMWWKAMKEADVETFVASYPYDVSIADKSIDIDQLWD